MQRALLLRCAYVEVTKPAACREGPNHAQCVADYRTRTATDCRAESKRTANRNDIHTDCSSESKRSANWTATTAEDPSRTAPNGKRSGNSAHREAEPIRRVKSPPTPAQPRTTWVHQSGCTPDERLTLSVRYFLRFGRNRDLRPTASAASA
jgi:hypothetical protein